MRISDLNAGVAVTIAVAVTLLVYTPSLFNRWSPDDLPIVVNNPATESVEAGWANSLSNYWPAEARVGGGLYRPLPILTLAADRQLSRGRPFWSHGVNLALHAAIVAVVVLLALRWLSAGEALLVGLVFGLHPVQVEAVAPVVGRVDLLAALGMLGSVYAFRMYRDGRSRWWLGVLYAALLTALFSKEIGAGTIALLAVDHWLDRTPAKRQVGNLYVAAFVITAGWFFLWNSIASAFVGQSAAGPLRGLGTSERIATAVPLQLDVLRLLVFPAELASDYNPLMVEIHTRLSVAGVVAALAVISLILLGLRLRRRAPGISFGILTAAISLLPVSNLLFPSGVLLAERTLYLAVLAPAFALVWVVREGLARAYRTGTAAAVGLIVFALGYRTVIRIPFWRDVPNVVVEEFVRHPENYRVRVRFAGALEKVGDVNRALPELTAAAAIFPADPFIAVRTVPLALRTGHNGIALREALRSLALAPRDPALATLAARAYLASGYLDSAMALARRFVELAPGNSVSAALYNEMAARAGLSGWRRTLGMARAAWIGGLMAESSRMIGGALDQLPETPGSGDCWEIGRSLILVRTLRGPGEANRLADRCPGVSRIP